MKTAPPEVPAEETVFICPADQEAVLAVGRALRVGPDVIRELLKSRGATSRAQMQALTAGNKNINPILPIN